MNIYKVANMLETVRGWFGRSPIGAQVGADAQNDMHLLYALSEETGFIRARNGKDYWYYFLYDAKNMDVARYLLKRNGVNTRVHWSRYLAYNGSPRPALRVRTSYILANPAVEDFVRSVGGVAERYNRDQVNEKILAVRAQMSQKQK